MDGGAPTGKSRRVVALTVTVVLLLAGALILLRFGVPRIDLRDTVHNLARKIELLSNMRVNLFRSAEAEKSAVMADTDQASRDYADQSMQASSALEQERLELDALIQKDHTDQELKLQQEFNHCWDELQRVDREVPEYAVQNTNLKAAALSFGKGTEAVSRLDESLTKLIRATPMGGKCNDIMRLACDARSAAYRALSLHAPHIAAATNEQMDRLEAEMLQAERTTMDALGQLEALTTPQERESLREAMEAFTQFQSITARVIGLSRQNANILSFELSLGKKRKIAAQCDEVLESLEEAVRSRTFRATR